MCHTELFGHFLSGGVQIDTDNNVGSGKSGALNDVKSDATEAKNDDVVTGLYLCGIEDSADAGCYTATDVANFFKRCVLANFGERNFRHNSVV